MAGGEGLQVNHKSESRRVFSSSADRNRSRRGSGLKNFTAFTGFFSHRLQIAQSEKSLFNRARSVSTVFWLKDPSPHFSVTRAVL